MKLMAFKLSQSEAFLCDLVGGYYDDKRIILYERIMENSNFITLVWSLACRNELQFVFVHKLIDFYGEESVPIPWLELHDTNSKKISAFLKELDKVAEILSKEDISVVVLKNGSIARAIHPCPGCCPMDDLDVLIEKHQFRKAHDILLGNGYQFKFRSPLEKTNIDIAEMKGSSEYLKKLPDDEEFWLELQWRPIAGRWIQENQEPSAIDLLSRSISLPGSTIRILCPEDNLLQVCLHTAKHSYLRAPGFRLHLDVKRIVDAYPNLAWFDFIKLVNKLKVKTAVYFSLIIPHELFGTPIPLFIIEKLRPPYWKEWLIRYHINKVGLFNSDESKFTRLQFILFHTLLYDNVLDIIHGIFPSPKTMKTQSISKGIIGLIIAYARRIWKLLFERLPI